MKRDYYSDIKLAQRIIFQNTAYLLTMLDKKVDSFTSLKTPNMRARERNDLLHPDNVLHPQAPKAAQNPLASLANDLTKPVWNCSTRFEPIAVSLLPHPASTDYQKMLSAFNYAMGRFFERCKGEHEDEVSLKLHVCLVDKAATLAAYAEAMGQGNRIQDLLQQLFRLLICANQAKLEKMDLENGIQHQKTELVAAMQILERLTTKNPQTLKHTHPQLLAEICSFTQLAQSHLKNVTESNSGPVYLNYHLQADNLALLLHPMLLASYCFIKNQIAAQEQAKDESSMSNDLPSHSQPPIFEDLKSCNCSKITFINLDGHESSLNLLLAKHLSKYLQYISFPEEQLSLVESDPELKSYFRWRSEMLTKEYLASEAAAQNFSRLFNSKDSSQLMTLNEFYKRLIVIPVKSIRMAQKKQKPDSPFPSVSGYESHFLSFIMKEVIYNQVRQFSPSVIIISHANTLPILPAHFQQIISQLAILTNMRVVFYNNLTHTLLPYAPPPQATGLFNHFHREYSKRREKWSMAALPFSRGENFPLSVDMLQRASIFLKICSGTANLGPQAREDDEKYQNSRVLGYSASIMREVCFKHPALSRYDNRFLQYLKIDKLFSNYYQPKAISWYHKNMVQSVEAVLFQYYGQTLIHSERWKWFSNEFALHMNKVSQSEQAKYFAKLNYPNSLQNDSIYGLIALQFQILENHVRKLITLSTETQIILSRNKHYATCPVFVLNHLSNYKSQTLSNYYGFIDEEVQNSCGARVALQELRFYQNHYNLSPYQHFTEFSYHQTQNSVILFWPLLYDAHQALLHSFSRSAYHPEPTSLFFVGSKSNLAVLSHMQPLNQSYKHLHPRIGCTCYQPPNSNLIYIFGGFYNELANYLDFQTDISVIRMEQSGISIENVPKSFFASQQQRKDFGYSIVTSINNDFVRPRVQYEVYQLQSEDNSTKQIILLGGIGQKFTRPFSLIGYMGHLIRFQHGLLSKIDRIKLNNVVPANLTRPTRQCAPTHLPVIKVAQNKRIYASSSPTRPGTLAFAHFPLRYVSQDPNLDKKCLGRYMARNRRMTYLKSYQVALDQRWVDCENQKQTVNTVMIREGNQARNIRWVLRHYSFGQKRQAQVLLTLDSKRSQTFALAFSLEDDAAQKFVNLEGNVVKLAPQHIIAADTYSLQTYALFCHPEYTQGLTVLARSNVRSINELTDNEINQISVSQIYSLDQSPENHIIKVMQGQQVAVVHGLQFGQTRYEEYLVRRVGSYYTRLRIQSSDFIKQIHEGLLAGDGLLRPNRKSFVLGHGHRLLCLTFVTLHRHSQTTQTTLLIIEQLTLTDPLLKWRVKSTTHVRFEVNFPQQMRSQVQRQPLLVCKEILDVYQISQSKDLFIVVGCENYVFEASTSLQNFNKIHELHFQPIRVANEENELELRHILCDDYESERMRDRQNGYHLYAKAINKGSALKGGSQVMSEERGSK